MFYLHPNLEVRKTSNRGMGLFTSKFIPKGTLIHISDGIIYTRNEGKKVLNGELEYCIDMDDNHIFCPKNYHNMTPDWYINHSCEPNSGVGNEFNILVAMNDINENEEITFDYAMTEFDPTYSLLCACGTKSCRKIITGNDWKIPVLQKRYRGYFSKAIEKKITNLNTEQHMHLQMEEE